MVTRGIGEFVRQSHEKQQANIDPWEGEASREVKWDGVSKSSTSDGSANTAFEEAHRIAAMDMDELDRIYEVSGLSWP
jgi:hypothetical protein